MNKEIKIKTNMFGQGIVESQELIEYFKKLTYHERKIYLREFVYYFLTQSKPVPEDIEKSIFNSKLKPTFTCCVLLRKGGIENHVLEKIISLPEGELQKSYTLLLSLYKIAYSRRYELEKNDSKKWWYWDLSKKENLLLLDNKVI